METIIKRKIYSSTADNRSALPYIGFLILAVGAATLLSTPESSNLGTYLWEKYGTTDLPATLVFQFAYTYHYSIWLYALTVAGVLSGGTAVLLSILLSL